MSSKAYTRNLPPATQCSVKRAASLTSIQTATVTNSNCQVFPASIHYLCCLNNCSVNYCRVNSLRNWIEYGFKQVKNELGWADFRLTDYGSIERCWEIIFSAYLMVSLHADYFQSCLPSSSQPSSAEASSTILECFRQHPRWEEGTTWKSALNNLRLIIQPYLFYCLLAPWLEVFSIPGFKYSFSRLMMQMNRFRGSPKLSLSIAA